MVTETEGQIDTLIHSPFSFSDSQQINRKMIFQAILYNLPTITVLDLNTCLFVCADQCWLVIKLDREISMEEAN